MNEIETKKRNKILNEDHTNINQQKRKTSQIVNITKKRKNRKFSKNNSETENIEPEKEQDTTEESDHNDFRITHKRTVKTGTTIFIPHDILKSSKIQSVAMRNKISPVGLSAIIEAIIETCDGEKSKVNLHHSQSYRYIEILYIASKFFNYKLY